MDKEQTLAFLKSQLSAGVVSKGEILETLGENTLPTPKVQSASASLPEENTSSRFTKVFYLIGGIVALLGVIVMITENWNYIGFIGRIAVTLGVSFGTYVVALFVKDEEQSTLSSVLFMVSAILAPIGAFILFDEIGIKITPVVHMLTGLMIGVMYSTALFVNRKEILVFIATAFFTWSYSAAVAKVGDLSLYDFDIYKYAAIILGVVYLALGFWFDNVFLARVRGSNSSLLREIFNGLGATAILGGGIAIGGLFDIVFIGFIFAAFYGSIFIRSRAMLAVGAVFLVAHTFKVTSKYFLNSIDWSLALILAGFLVMGVGYFTFYLNKKYISGK